MPGRTHLIRVFFCISAPSALALGLLVLCPPIAFAPWLGMVPASGSVPGTLYGSVLVGVGAVSLAGIRHPERHASLLLFIGIYKGVAAMVLGWSCWHGAVSGFVVPCIALLYGLLALTCLPLYPWQVLAPEPDHG